MRKKTLGLFVLASAVGMAGCSQNDPGRVTQLEQMITSSLEGAGEIYGEYIEIGKSIDQKDYGVATEIIENRLTASYQAGEKARLAIENNSHLTDAAKERIYKVLDGHLKIIKDYLEKK